MKEKTIKRKRLNLVTMGVRNKPDVVILNGYINRWVGIGWVEERKATEEDKKKYPKVID